jgi:hypothetical protein
MRQKCLILVLVLLLSALTAFAGGPAYDSVAVGSPTISCSGNVSIDFTLDWNYASSSNWELRVDGTLINSGTVNATNPLAVDTFTVSGTTTPRNDPSVTVDLRIYSNAGIGYDQTHSRITSMSLCPSGGDEDTPAVVVCDDGRLNTACDLVAIYALEDFEGTHMQVWYVLPGDGSNGQFAFMLYQDELDALPDNPDEPMLIASSEDNFVNLYWLPDNSFMLTAGPDAEGKTRVFTFTTFPGEITSYTLEP